ncbi:hypothetical protein GGF32_008165 [Allomyces javanicus]|nr:hypothetical protein GGF32_008165 [Allomyces javanicus]
MSVNQNHVQVTRPFGNYPTNTLVGIIDRQCADRGTIARLVVHPSPANRNDIVGLQIMCFSGNPRDGNDGVSSAIFKFGNTTDTTATPITMESNDPTAAPGLRGIAVAADKSHVFGIAAYKQTAGSLLQGTLWRQEQDAQVQPCLLGGLAVYMPKDVVLGMNMAFWCPPTVASTTSTTATSTTTTTSSSSATAGADTRDGQTSSSTALGIGLGVGATVLVALIAVFVFFRRRQQQRAALPSQKPSSDRGVSPAGTATPVEQPASPLYLPPAPAQRTGPRTPDTLYLPSA